jgi:hypothetical protein
MSSKFIANLISKVATGLFAYALVYWGTKDYNLSYTAMIIVSMLDYVH